MVWEGKRVTLSQARPIYLINIHETFKTVHSIEPTVLLCLLWDGPLQSLFGVLALLSKPLKLCISNTAFL